MKSCRPASIGSRSASVRGPARAHEVEQVVVEVKIRQSLRRWRRWGAFKYHGQNARGSGLVTPLPAQGVAHLLQHPPRFSCSAGPEQQEQVTVIDVSVELSLPANARFQVEDVLEEADAQGGQHLHALEDLGAVLRGVGDKRFPVARRLVP